MEPVRCDDHNFIYKGPSPDIGDLSVRRENGAVYSHWKPTPEELAILNSGGVVELGIYHEPIPPVSVSVAGRSASQQHREEI